MNFRELTQEEKVNVLALAFEDACLLLSEHLPRERQEVQERFIICAYNVLKQAGELNSSTRALPGVDLGDSDHRGRTWWL